MKWPDIGDIESSAKSILEVSALIGGTWALVTRWLRRRKARREKKALEEKTLRYLVDAMHHVLDVMTPNADGRETNATELQRQNILIRGIREELWHADGHATDIERLREVITRTQAIRMLKEKKADSPQDVFADEENYFRDKE